VKEGLKRRLKVQEKNRRKIMIRKGCVNKEVKEIKRRWRSGGRK
jgi:hypothetical protein